MSFAANTPIHFVPGVGRRTAKILHNLGIHTAGQFRNVPEAMLVELFGPSIREVTSLVSVGEAVRTAPAPKKVVKEEAVKQPLMKRIQHAWQFVGML